MLKVIVLSVLLVGLAVFLLASGLFTRPGKKFPSGHIHSNEALRAKGIDCHHNM